MSLQQGKKKRYFLTRVMQPMLWMSLLMWFPLLVSSTQHPGGDIAPYGNPDNQINVADLLVLQRFVAGDLTPAAEELLIVDVAPLGAPDGVLNAGDIVVLQQAVLGLITLPDVTVGPPAPVLLLVQSPTNVNPHAMSGTTEPGMEVRIYVDGLQQFSTMADGTGAFQLHAYLEQGTNAVHVTAWDGTFESDPSNTLNIDFVYEPPTAVHGGPYTGPVNLKTFFDGSGSFDKYWYNLTFNWDFGDGSFGTGETPSHVYTSTGTYTVTLTVSANGISSTPVSTTVEVKNTEVIFPVIADGTVLTNDKIYIFDGTLNSGSYGNVVLTQLSTLTVEAGTEIRVDRDTTLVVNGTLNINGTASNPVTIRGRDGNFPKWYGIHLNQYSNAVINHAIIEDAFDGVAVLYNGANAVIKNSTFQKNSSAITIISSPLISSDTRPLVKGNSIRHNSAGVLVRGDARPLVIDGNIIRHNQTGINLWADAFDGNPRPVINNNAIDHNVQNYYANYTYPDQEIILDTHDNWWGTTDSVLINRSIEDSRDTPRRATVDLGQIKSLPIDDELVVDPIYEETADKPYLVKGTAPAGAEVNVYAYGADIYFAGTAIADANGRFSIGYTFPEEDTYYFFARRVVNGKEVEESEWTLKRIEYTAVPWWQDVPEFRPITSPTTSNPLPVSIYSEKYFQEANVYVNGELQGLAYEGRHFDATLNVGTNTITATFLTPTGESAHSAPVVVEYIPESTLPDYSGGTISGTLLLPPVATPYQITSDIVIGQNARLVILAGAELEFSGGTRIAAAGKLEILGDAGNPAHLRSAAAIPAQSDWVGIEVPAGANQKTRIEHALIEHAISGVWFNGGTASLTDATLQNNFYGVLVEAGTSPVISTSTLQNNSVGIRVNGNATPQIYPHNTITGNTQGVDLVGTGLPGGNPLPRLNENNIFGNTQIDLATATFFDAPNATLDARGNWWGTTDSTTIDASIFDSQDNPTDLPTVDYLPVQPALLTAASPLSPALAITVPSTTSSAYTVNGFAEPNREIQLYLNGQLAATLTSDTAGDFSQTVTLAAGTNTLYAIAVNGAEQSLPYLTYMVASDTTPPLITLTTPTEGGLVNYATVFGQLDEAATLTVDGGTATVNPDNSFNHILAGLPQGLNAIELVATDPAGNSSTLNVSFTLDSQPPAIPDTGQITVGALSGGQVTITAPAGSATAGDTVTLINTRTGTSVQTTITGDGSYSADVGAQAGDEIVILISDPVGNTAASRILQVAGSPPALGFTIDTPADGSTVEETHVAVSGTFQGGANTGISVNGTPAQIIGNTFCTGDIPLDASSNQLDVTATAPDGTATTQPITVTSTGSSLTELEADTDTGFAPHTVTFSLTDNTGATLTTIEYDVDSDGTPDYTTTDPAATVQYTYTTPGCYTATVTATDDAAVTYTATHTILVQDVLEVDGQLSSIFYGMLNKLRAGDITGAAEAIVPEHQNRYSTIFTNFGPELSVFIDGMGVLTGGAMNGDIARYVEVRNVNGIPKIFMLYLVRGDDGVWRVEGM
jgi:PKD repeat protein